MAEKSEIVEQTRLAFDFLQRLYIEASYLIKEIEGLLKEEKFIIGKPSGYSINTRTSTGLEATNVAFWIIRRFSVFFVQEDRIKHQKGQTITPIDKALKLIYLRIVLNDDKLREPTLYSGVLYDIVKQPQAKRITKFENLMGYFQYVDSKMFKDPEKVDFEDATLKIKGKFIKNHLFDINDSKTIEQKIIKPTLELFSEN